jgi:hypothetical protein
MSSVVKIDPEIMGGAPCFAGTRVPIQNLIDYLEGGDSIEDFLEGGEVKVETRSFPDSLVAALATLPSMSLVPSAPFSSTSVSIA